jgi:hypothetical protein
MSIDKGNNCWDHEPTESLWGSREVCRLHGKNATQREEMDEVIDWLTFYNHRRGPQRGQVWQLGGLRFRLARHASSRR